MRGLVTAAVFATLLTTLGAGAWPGTSASAQEPTQQASQPNQERMHQDMMAMRKQMMAERQGAQTALQTLLDR